eukprot:TRINITY_DN6698_c0_g1_i1.p1 TRINITY_DN6698_c0_g1~~TRINITY_DN6698_c0_g1_i1.p1  ORF type:complete len:1274 (-),score=325.43 TRINITY_DN6698_c0_g1_i1:47-3868(-)
MSENRLAYAILPKEETQSLQFVTKYPTLDGRGVVVAIFDTGVDPGADGLQVTTDGKPKIIDVVDCSGSGDVDTSAIRRCRDDGVLLGLTGRELRLGNWSNPSGDYRVGLKRAYELWPAGLVQRVKSERKKKWDVQHRLLVVAAQQELAEFDRQNPAPISQPPLVKRRAELDARIEALNTLQSSYEDPGPIVDCVVFNDGSVWRAVVDTKETSDLTAAVPMTDFCVERQYCSFSEESMLNYSVNIYDNGNVLSIVVDAGAHGTHVAGIVAAHHPEKPELNGVAPGAQLISVKIGDSRLGSMETVSSMVRGILHTVAKRTDLINMSYGEAASIPNSGRFVTVLNEAVNKHGVIFVSSAGNSGPALTTAGAPGSTSSSAIGVGAYVSPAMMDAEYSMLEKLPETMYTWTSRGPTTDGALGVTICGPGGAIAPVPEWTLQHSMLMNGTSMSSPNVCGGLALLLSALKAEGVAYTPHRIKNAIQNTARAVENVEVFATGAGLLQVERAFEHLMKNAQYAPLDVRYDVDFPTRGGARGLYLRDKRHILNPCETTVRVNPVFHEEAHNADRVAFEVRVALYCAQDWVKVPQMVVLMYGGRQFPIRVDPTQLPPGAHYAEIVGVDMAHPDAGPLFRVPITAIRAHTGSVEPIVESVSDNESERESERETTPTGAASQVVSVASSPADNSTAFVFTDMVSGPGRLHRRFIHVPVGATWADVTVSAQELQDSVPMSMVLHCVQLVNNSAFTKYESQRWFQLTSVERHEVVSYAVLGGETLEVCLAQGWSATARGRVSLRVSFHGIVPSSDQITLLGSELYTPVQVTTPIRVEDLNPAAQLKRLQRSVRPTSAKVQPLRGQRDRLPDGRQISELVLEYSFNVPEAGDVLLRVPPINSYLYDAELESPVSFMLFDANKKFIGSSEYRPKAIKLSKGDYVARVQMRHDDTELLNKFKSTLLIVDRALASAVTVTVHNDPRNAISATSPVTDIVSGRGARVQLFLTAPAQDKLPKEAALGDVLTGEVTFGKARAGVEGAGKRPNGYSLVFVVPPPVPAAPAASAKEASVGDEATDDILLRDAKVARLIKHREGKRFADYDKLAAELRDTWSNHMPLLQDLLLRNSDDATVPRTVVVEAANAVLAQIDTHAIAAHFGMRAPTNDPAWTRANTDMEKQRNILTDALYRRGIAQLDLRDTSVEQTVTELARWVDVTESKWILLYVGAERLAQRPGLALKALNKQFAAGTNPTRKLQDIRMSLLQDLQWTLWRDYDAKQVLVRWPAAYPLF